MFQVWLIVTKWLKPVTKVEDIRDKRSIVEVNSGKETDSNALKANPSPVDEETPYVVDINPHPIQVKKEESKEQYSSKLDASNDYLGDKE